MITAAPTAIKELLDEFKKEEEHIHQQLVDICFFMKGGVSWNECWSLSFYDRNTMIKTINKRNKEASGDTREYM